MVVCPACGGVGRTSGAADLFGRHPLTEVRLSDREPRLISDSLGVGYCWSRWHSRSPNLHQLPDELRDSLSADNAMDIEGGYIRWRTAQLAHAALSAACVTYGRKLAGLPEKFTK